MPGPAACGAVILAARPAAVINAAAYTAVDRAESEPDVARLINRDAPEAMAVACAGLGIREDRDRITHNLSRFKPHFIQG